MKKRIFIIALIMMFSLLAGDISTVLALDTSDAQYIGSIREKNSSYTATNVCVPFTLNTDFLINAGYIESDCSDTAITLTNGDSIPYMPAVDTGTDWIMFDNQISQNSAENFNLYIGGGTDMEGDIVYFPAAGGMTIADAASLEPGNNFEIEVSGYVDTSAGADKNIIYKGEGFKLYISDDEEITGAFFVFPTVIGSAVSETASDNVNHVITLPAGYAAGDLLIVGIQTYDQNTITFPGGWTQLYSTTYIRYYYKVSAGDEGASITVTTSSADKSSQFSIAVRNFTGVPIIQTASGSSVNPDPPSNASGFSISPLWIAAFTTRGNCGNVTDYPDGFTSCGYQNNGAGDGTGAALSYKYDINTTLDPSTFTFDYTSRPWCAVTIAVEGQIIDVVASSINSGEMTIKLTADGTNLKLYLDDVLKDTEALDGVSVFNNSNDWVFCENNSVLYLRSAEMTVSGTLKGSWAWENDTTFTDLSGNGNDATPTFRTISSDADVEAEIITLESILPAEYEVVDGDISPIITTTMTAPAELYDESGVRLPGADLINELLDAADIPHSLFWYPVLFGMAAFFGLLTYFFARDILIQGIVDGAFLAFFGVMGGIPFWGVIPFALMVLAIIISRKTVSL